MKQLEELDVPYEVKVASAHRKPASCAEVHEWASSAVDRGIRVIIAAAGKAAHLGGVVAACTPLPVIAVPMKTSDLARFGLAAFHGSDAQRRTCRNGCYQWRKECRHPGCSMLGTGNDEARAKIEKLKADMAEA